MATNCGASVWNLFRVTQNFEVAPRIRENVYDFCIPSLSVTWMFVHILLCCFMKVYALRSFDSPFPSCGVTSHTVNSRRMTYPWSHVAQWMIKTKNHSVKAKLGMFQLRNRKGPRLSPCTGWAVLYLVDIAFIVCVSALVRKLAQEFFGCV